MGGRQHVCMVVYERIRGLVSRGGSYWPVYRGLVRCFRLKTLFGRSCGRVGESCYYADSKGDERDSYIRLWCLKASGVGVRSQACSDAYHPGAAARKRERVGVDGVATVIGQPSNADLAAGWFISEVVVWRFVPAGGTGAFFVPERVRKVQKRGKRVQEDHEPAQNRVRDARKLGAK